MLEEAVLMFCIDLLKRLQCCIDLRILYEVFVLMLIAMFCIDLVERSL